MALKNLTITTVILAGGLGTRIGGNKALKPLNSRPLISWVLEIVKPDSEIVLINANDLQDEYSDLDCKIIADLLPDRPGPLAGLHAALNCMNTEFVLTVPCDTPFLPQNLIEKLANAQITHSADGVVAVVNGQKQPTIVLYHKSVLPKLLAFLGTGNRKVRDWLDCLQLSDVIFDNAHNFENINSLEELALAQQLLTDKE